MADLPPLEPLPFAEAIAWARARAVVLPETYYGTLQAQARAQAFTISGLTSLDQIQQVSDSLTAALESGESMAAWQKRVADGEIPLDLGIHNTETIFRNNIQQAYNHGRYEQQAAAVASHPWFMYDAVDDSRTRPAHAAQNGKVARHDDPYWSVWSPSNGHRCRCKRIALTDKQAATYQAQDAERLAGDPALARLRASASPDEGWGINIHEQPNAGLERAITQREAACTVTQFAARRGGGKKVWCHDEAAQALPQLKAVLASNGDLPAPRRLDLPLLPTGQPERFYLERFMAAFGEPHDGTAVLDAPSGERLAVSAGLFVDHKTGKTKINKEGRAPYVPYIVETIKRPDEIRLLRGDYGDQRLYFLARYLIQSRLVGILAVFIEHGKIWEGWSGYQVPLASQEAYFESKRGAGRLAYLRRET